ncbi:unnamed protein product [Sphacelaria rigidula]
MERATKLVNTTPPRGEEYLRMLHTVLHRESSWTQWKANKCEPIKSVAQMEEKKAKDDKEAAAAAAAGGSSTPKSAQPALAKRPRPNAAKNAQERRKHAPLGSDFPLVQLVRDLLRNR